MKRYYALVIFGAIFVLALAERIVYSDSKATPSPVQVHLVITDQTFDDKSEVPVLSPQNLKVKVGKDEAKIQQLIPAQGDNAAMQLFILIDDTCETAPIGNNLNDLRDFISAQPSSTLVGVAYMSNATIQVAQNLTVDHAAAAKAVRLPRGSSSAMDSPYLSLVSLVKSWPQQNVRREVLMVSDGIDRLRGDTTGSSPFSASSGMVGPSAATGMPTMAPSPAMTTMPTIPVDADTASRASQRYGVIVHSIYATGVGHLGRNAWEAQLGQGGIAKITDETGGEYFALGTENAVSFKPYLERLQKIFNNQYFLVLQVTPRKKEGLQRVRVSTEVANADIASADNVWVGAAGG
jgi:hypothetical protein